MPDTAMPMKLPSGQVVWVRVSDGWDEDAVDGQGAPAEGSTPARGAGHVHPDTPEPAAPSRHGNGFHGNGFLGLRRNRRLAAAMREAPPQLYGFTDAVSGIAESVHAALERAAPDTVEIVFGLDVDFMSGVAVSLIADAHAKAAVRIRLGWNAPGGGGEEDDSARESSSSAAA